MPSGHLDRLFALECAEVASGAARECRASTSALRKHFVYDANFLSKSPFCAFLVDNTQANEYGNAAVLLIDDQIAGPVDSDTRRAGTRHSRSPCESANVSSHND